MAAANFNDARSMLSLSRVKLGGTEISRSRGVCCQRLNAHGPAGWRCREAMRLYNWQQGNERHALTDRDISNNM